MRMNRLQWLSQFFQPVIRTPRPKPERPKKQLRRLRRFEITLPDGRAQVFRAMTQSEARAQAKRFWSLDRVPVGSLIREVVDAGTAA